MMPIFMRGSGGRAGRAARAPCRSAPRGTPRAPRGSRAGVAEDRGGEQRGVGGARHADGERADRDAGRHLHDRQQRVEAVQRLRLDRHAEHRQRSLRGRHAGQVRGAAGAGDQHLEAALAGRGRVLEQEVGRAVRRDHAHFVRDAELLERLGRGPQGLPVGGRAHDDADERFHRGIVAPATRPLGRAGGQQLAEAAEQLARRGRRPRGIALGPGLARQRAQRLQVGGAMIAASSVHAAASSASRRSRHCSITCSLRTRCRSVSARRASAAGSARRRCAAAACRCRAAGARGRHGW
jgi:hypothetical protein